MTDSRTNYGQQIDNLIAQAKEMEQQRKQTQRTGQKNIDFEKVNKKIESMRMESLEWLNNALKGDE